MGLDQYLYKVSEVTDRELKMLQYRSIYNLPSTKRCSFCAIPCNDSNSIAEIKHLCKKAMFIESYTDMEQICLDFNIPKDAYYTGFVSSSEGYRYTFTYDGKETKVQLSEQEMDKYTLYCPVECYVYKTQKIAYWRKNYTLDDAMRTSSQKGVGNCKYVICNEKMLQLAVDEGVSYEDIALKDNEKSEICYYIWY